MVVTIIVVTVVVVVVGTVLLLRQGHPEQTASHDDHVRDESDSDRLYGGASRPAGPDAEG